MSTILARTVATAALKIPPSTTQKVLYVLTGVLFVAINSSYSTTANKRFNTLAWALAVVVLIPLDFFAESDLGRFILLGLFASLVLNVRLHAAWHIVWSDIPGPSLARHTCLVKLWHVHCGTYKDWVLRLHKQYGKVIRIAPNEFSVSTWDAFSRRCTLELLRPTSSDSLDCLERALQMANIFHYEPAIERCIQQLIEKLDSYAQNEGEIDLTKLIECFAYDAMSATSTGTPFGFLEKPQNASQIVTAVRQWKFWAVLHGSYFRFHPFISAVLAYLQPSRNLESAISRMLGAHAGASIASRMLEATIANGKGEPLPDSTVAACLAMLMAATDPIIQHLLISLVGIYSDNQLLADLRKEIKSRKVPYPPKLKDLIHRKARMPVLYQTLARTHAVCEPDLSESTFNVVDGEILWNSQTLPNECSIGLAPGLFQTGKFFQHQMTTFDASTCPGYNLHIALVAKFIVTVIPHFDVDMPNYIALPTPTNVGVDYQAMMQLIQSTTGVDARIYHTKLRMSSLSAMGSEIKIEAAPKVAAWRASSPDKDNTSPATESKIESTPVSFKDMSELQLRLGHQTANDLIWRFDPSRETLQGKPIKSSKVNSAFGRKIVHQIVERLWGGRLNHKTIAGDCMLFSVKTVRKPAAVAQEPKLVKHQVLKPKVAQPLDAASAQKTSVWFKFAKATDTAHTAATNNLAQYLEDKTTTDSEWQAAQKVLAEVPQSTNQTFKVRKDTKPADTESVASSTETEAGVSNKTTFVPPHLRKAQ